MADYEQLIINSLRDDLSEESRALAVEIIGAVIHKAKQGDVAAVQWLEGKAWLTRTPDIKIKFADDDE